MLRNKNIANISIIYEIFVINKDYIKLENYITLFIILLIFIIIILYYKKYIIISKIQVSIYYF